VVSRLYSGVARTRLAARALATLPPAPWADHLTPSLVQARQEVHQATDGLRTWYLAAASALAGHDGDAPPPLAPVTDLHAHLVGAFAVTRVTRRLQGTAQVARRISAGDLDARVDDPHTKDPRRTQD